MVMPKHKNPCPGRHEIYNFGRPFLGNHYYLLSLSDLCLDLRNTCTSILHFLPQNYLLGGGGHEIYNFLSPYHTDATYQIWLRLAQ